MMSEFKSTLSKKLDDVNQASKNRVSKIKNIWSDYFGKHEDTVELIQNKVLTVTNAFDEWKMYVMNPQSINEARIHSLDIKCDAIETQALGSFTVIFQIVRKLLFSLQQQALVNSTTPEFAEDELSQGKFLDK